MFIDFYTKKREHESLKINLMLEFSANILRSPELE